MKGEIICRMAEETRQFGQKLWWNAAESDETERGSRIGTTPEKLTETVWRFERATDWMAALLACVDWIECGQHPLKIHKIDRSKPLSWLQST